MKINKIKQGEYRITLHCHSFILAKLYGCRDWTLWNDTYQTEINRAQTKRGMLELMQHWSPEYTETQARQEFCTYA